MGEFLFSPEWALVKDLAADSMAPAHPSEVRTLASLLMEFSYLWLVSLNCFRSVQMAGT